HQRASLNAAEMRLTFVGGAKLRARGKPHALGHPVAGLRRARLKGGVLFRGQPKELPKHIVFGDVLGRPTQGDGLKNIEVDINSWHVNYSIYNTILSSIAGCCEGAHTRAVAIMSCICDIIATMRVQELGGEIRK